MGKTAKVHWEPMTSDLIFKAVYGQDKDSSRQALIALLNLVLERRDDPIVKLVHKNPFSIAETPKQKVIIMDIRVETEQQEQIDIEMRVETTGKFIKRSVYYGCEMITEGLENGENYVKLKKSIVICFVKTEDEVISMTDEVLKKVSEDERLRIERISREKWKFDQAAAKMEAKEDGFAEGREAGLEAGLKEGLEEGRKGGIKAFIEICEELELSGEDTLAKFETKFAIPENIGKEYLLRYWK